MITNSKIDPFILKSFNELSNHELYEILQLRSEIFVVEQNCIYNDLDGLDQEGFHLFAKNNDEIITYVRILKPGTRFNEASIGRVITPEKHRKKGYSRAAMKKAIDLIQTELNATTIKISAQKYLLGFYTSLGFVVITEEYLEDGIPHFGMLLKRTN